MNPTLPPEERPGVTYRQALEILAAHGLRCSLKTLKRWTYAGILNAKRITHRTVILFRDEVEALAKKGDPWE